MQITKSKLMKLFLILFTFSLIANASSLIPLDFLPIEESDTLKIRFCHILFIPFFLIVITYSKYLKKEIIGFFCVLIFFVVYSVIVSQYWWINHYVINYFWSALCFLCGGIISCNRNINVDSILNAFIKVTIIFYVLVFIKNIFYLDDILFFFSNPNVHPLIPTLVGGGLNLEATFLATMSIFAYKRKKLFIIFIIFSFIFSILYSSRVGIICCILVLILVLYFYSRNKAEFILKIVGVSLLLAIAFYILFMNDVYIIERLASIGDSSEAGTRGRLYMWAWIYPTVINNIWGYGAGNAVDAIGYMAGNKAIFWNSNVHLYPMQVLLDFGILGFFFYLFTVFYVIRQVFRADKNSFVFFAVLFIYIILGFIQFKGGEPLIYLVAGIAVGFNNKKIRN